MSQLVRIYRIDRLLRRRKPPSKRELLAELEISEPTLKRDLEVMRDQMHAPIVWDREAGGYRYDPADYNLPGLWFSPAELHALLVMQSLLEQLQPGLVRDALAPFKAKLRSLVDGRAEAHVIESRVQIVSAPWRPVDDASFQVICAATLERKKLRLRYFTRHRAAEGERTVSPQKLIQYRGNWYLDAWCHEQEAWRRFAIDAVREAHALDEPAFEPPAAPGEGGYGIFPGLPQETAVLDFDAAAARWVADEEWHSCQKAVPLPDGGIRLEVPYSHPQEILMDILRHAAHVEVVRPESLRCAVVEAHEQAAAVYLRAKRAVARDTHPAEKILNRLTP